METVNAPAAGWYPDPAGSTSQRWWDGAGWTTHLYTPEPAPVPEPLAVPDPVPVAAAYEGDPRFGGPSAPASGPAPTQPVAAAAAHGPVRSGRPTSHLVIAAAAVVVLLLGAVFVAKTALGGSDPSDTGDPAGVTGLLTPGNPQLAAMKADVLNVANAEESYFSDKQVFVAGTGAKGSMVLAGHQLRLSSAGETVSVVLSPSGVGYCIRAARAPVGGGALQVVVYVSTHGGLQPPLVKTCPAAF